MNKNQKTEQIENIKEKVSRCKMMIVAEYQGMNVESISNLRRRLRKEAASEYVVFKNTLLKKVLPESSALLKDPKLLKGPNGIVFSYDDPAKTAKVVTEVAGKLPKFVVKGGVLGDRKLNMAQIEALSKLPPREVVLAQVLGGMKAPITGFVTVCSGVIRGFVNCINEIKKNKEEAKA